MFSIFLGVALIQTPIFFFEERAVSAEDTHPALPVHPKKIHLERRRDLLMPSREVRGSGNRPPFDSVPWLTVEQEALGGETACSLVLKLLDCGLTK